MSATLPRSRQRRYSTREQIVDRIEFMNRRFDADSLEAAECGRQADIQFADAAKQKNPEDAKALIGFGQGNPNREQKLIRILKRVPEKLAQLKRTLAAFDTENMPFIDQSIVEQK